ncbi:MAG: acetyl-coenzyme A synthetase N-terminal domain-containing protein, partial [Solirubrobacteraceae bacterium]
MAPDKSVSEHDDELELEHELAALLDVERFEPSQDFKEHALLSDPAIYEQAEGDWQGWWEHQAQNLHWFKQWDQVLDDSNP